MEKEVNKTAVQLRITELRQYLPKNFTKFIAAQFEVTPEHVRAVWSNRRENVKIMDATIAAIETAKKEKSKLDKKIEAV